MPVLFHNVWSYDYHFIMKELANKPEGKLDCSGENTENHKVFPFQ